MFHKRNGFQGSTGLFSVQESIWEDDPQIGPPFDMLTCRTEVRRWWNGPLPVAKMTPVLAVGITTCPALPVSSTAKPPWQISNGSTTAPLRGRTNFAACHRAPVAAGSPVTIASQGIRCMPH